MSIRTRSLARLSVFISAVLLFLFPQLCHGVRNLGVVGKTYPIAERDMEEFLKEKAARASVAALNAEVARQAEKSFHPDFPIPRATERLVKHIDPSIVVTEDIKDHQGNVLVPKGIVINPLDQVMLLKTYIVIDGTDENQLGFAASFQDPKRVFLTRGDPFHAAGMLGRDVFTATWPVLQRFEIGHVPAVVRQEGRLIRVEEVPVD